MGIPCEVDWKKKYQELVALVEKHLPTLNAVEQARYQITNMIRTNAILERRERNVVKLLRLIQDYEAVIEYDNGQRNIRKMYPAGTLIDSDNGYVYLDDDGDGNIYFPKEVYEVVELDEDTVNWVKVITGG